MLGLSLSLIGIFMGASDYNIHKGRVAAYKALMNYLANNEDRSENLYVPELSEDDERLQDISLTSYTQIRESWMAMYEHWKYPDVFIVVESTSGAVYTQVNKHVLRESDLSQARLF